MWILIRLWWWIIQMSETLKPTHSERDVKVEGNSVVQWSFFFFMDICIDFRCSPRAWVYCSVSTTSSRHVPRWKRSKYNLNRELRADFGHLGHFFFFGDPSPKTDDLRPCYMLQDARVFRSWPQLLPVTWTYGWNAAVYGWSGTRNKWQWRLSWRWWVALEQARQARPYGMAS